MNKKTLIFDASVLAESYNVCRGRTGIYFTSYNILKNIINYGQFNVSLFCSDAYDEGFVQFIKDNFGNDIKIYSGNKYSYFLKKLSDLDQKLRKSHHNILKLLLNIFVRKPVKYIGRAPKTTEFDIALSTCKVFFNKIKADKKYIVLYDAIPLLYKEYYITQLQAVKQHWFSVLIKYIKSKPDCKYFAISEHTKNDFVKLLGINPNNITVMPLAVSDSFYQEKNKTKIEEIRAKYGIPDGKKYIFSLCTLEPRKNLIRAVKTFIEFVKNNGIKDIVFVLGGIYWDKFIGKLESEIEGLGEYKNKIIRAGYVADEDLAVLYSGAEFFVYTSRYEGFGLPPLEAMKCGCPVITSNNSSLPEVVGDAAIMIDWDNDEQHIDAYKKYYFDASYRENMAQKGLERSRLFTWEKTVDIIINTIKGNVNESNSVQTERNR